jgi:adenylate kinase
MIIFLGAAGAGKSLQGKMLADELGWAWISTGEFLRMLVVGERRIEMLSGKLISDSEMISMVDKIFRLIDTKGEFILDGFPRTLPQAEWLLAQIKAGLIDLKAVVCLQANPETIYNRLQKRGRLDDTEEVISRRIDAYRIETQPLIQIYKEQQVPVFEIDSNGSIEEVHDKIVDAVNSL